uniref:NADH dehydrogenase [ubiquinone] 1 alpha subcomplex subunit 5 n=1 Tax=Cairina moschata TaxID=8855 RepID=A0A8C3BQU6_CAIMO
MREHTPRVLALRAPSERLPSGCGACAARRPSLCPLRARLRPSAPRMRLAVPGCAAMAGALRKRLRILYAKILGVLQNIPKDAAYRKYTEQIVNQRLNLVQTETDVQKLQDKLNSGQIEEVIVQAENELSLSRKMLQWKPWEPLVEEPPSNQWRWPI